MNIHECRCLAPNNHNLSVHVRPLWKVIKNHPHNHWHAFTHSSNIVVHWGAKRASLSSRLYIALNEPT